MKKIIIVVLLIALMCALTGCTGIDEEKFPQVRVCRSNLRYDNFSIALRPNHQFVLNHLYDEIETENGYDIILHIEKEN